MVVGLGFLLMVSLIVSAALAAVGHWIDGFSGAHHQVCSPTIDGHCGAPGIAATSSAVIGEGQVPWALSTFVTKSPCSAGDAGDAGVR